tara:strand:- start:76698 stop:77039 length:342 start_codon:yes stop_codon:yes gene_type:complete
MVIIIRKLILHKHKNEHTAGHSYSEPYDIDKGINFLFEKIPIGDFEVVFKHWNLKILITCPPWRVERLGVQKLESVKVERFKCLSAQAYSLAFGIEILNFDTYISVPFSSFTF